MDEVIKELQSALLEYLEKREYTCYHLLRIFSNREIDCKSTLNVADERAVQRLAASFDQPDFLEYTFLRYIRGSP